MTMSARSGSASTRPGICPLLEPREIVVLQRCPVLRLSGPGFDDEDASIEVAAGQPPDKTSGIGGDHDAELLEQLAGERIDVRLARLDVTAGRVPAVRSPHP